MDAATAKFGQALPCALQPIASQLAALHASRTHAIPPCSCSRCGSLLALRTRVVRGKHNTHTRAIVHTCSVCEEATSTTIGTGSAAAFPPRKRRAHNVPAPPPSPVTKPYSADEVNVLPSNTKPLATLSVQASSSKATPPPVDRPSQRPNTKRKKSTLQEMLHRNRDNEKMRTNAEDARPAGLSAFLSTL